MPIAELPKQLTEAQFVQSLADKSRDELEKEVALLHADKLILSKKLEDIQRRFGGPVAQPEQQYPAFHPATDRFAFFGLLPVMCAMHVSNRNCI